MFKCQALNLWGSEQLFDPILFYHSLSSWSSDIMRSTWGKVGLTTGMICFCFSDRMMISSTAHWSQPSPENTGCHQRKRVQGVLAAAGSSRQTNLHKSKSFIVGKGKAVFFLAAVKITRVATRESYVLFDVLVFL